MGVTADAKVTLKVNENTPSNLYYKLSPIDVSDNLTENKEIVDDEDVILNNNITTIESIYNGEFKIVSTGSTTFTYDLEVAPESDSYSPTTSTLRYATISTSAYGSIDQIRIEGFERSILTLISSGGPAEWWNSSKTAFSSDFVKYADKRLSTDSFHKPIHPGMNND